MKRFPKSIFGVTLLEIMLVLAIAAMIIVMSVRYYQSANSSQQANSLLEQLQSITAAADGLSEASGSYASPLVGNSSLQPLLPNGTNAFTTPWGTTIAVTDTSSSSYTVAVPGTPAAVCPLVVTKLMTNNHYSGLTTSTCAKTGSTSFTYTYVANP